MEKELKKIFLKVFDISENWVVTDISKDKIHSWDSLGHINLISAIQDKFSLFFSPDEIERMHDNFITVKEIVESRMR